MLFRDAPIQRKLVLIILLTSAVSLLLMRTIFLAHEYLTFRQAMLRQSATLARMIAANSTAVRTFGDEQDAEEILSDLQAEGSVVAAAFYDAEGKLFSRYPTNLPLGALPEKPLADGFSFGGSYLTGFEPVMERGNRKGTLYLQFDKGSLVRAWLRVSALIALGLIAFVLAVAYLVSRKLQQQISRPILALAETAKAISARRDFSVRATKVSEDELGLLTDAFNQMLTQIEKQNQALRESEARVRAVLDSALSAVVVVDSAGRITDWNAQAEHMFGWTRAEALGLAMAETIMPPRFREAHRRELEKYLVNGEGRVLSRPLEMSALRRDGTEFPVELSISPMQGADAVTFCGFITDITERKAIQDALREAHRKTSTILDSITDGFNTFDRQWRYTYINKSAARILQSTPEELLGRNVWEVWPKAADSNFGKEFRRAVAENRPVQFVEFYPEPLNLWLETRCYPSAEGLSVFFSDVTERKRQEEMRARFMAIVQSSDDAIIGKTLPGVITSWNPGAEKLFGYTQAEVIGKPITMLLPPERLEEEKRTLERIARGDSVVRLETVRNRKDGTAIDVSVSVSPIKDGHGEVVGASTIARDITERKRAEGRFRAVVESSPQAIVLVNREGTITMVNAQTEKLFGYARADLIGQTIELLVPERFRGAHRGARGGFFAGSSARAMGARGELFGLRRDGQEVPVEIGLNPIETPEGLFVLASIVDISERKRAEQQVLLQATALQTAANAIMITDRAGTISWINPAFSALTGYTAEEIIGRNSRLLKSGQHDESFYRDLWSAILSGHTWRGGFTNRRKDGSLYQDEQTITPVRSEDGTITHFIAIMQDVTERKLAQRVLRKSETQLRLVWENALDGMRLVDQAGIIQRVNDAYCRMVEKPREALEGHPMSVLYEARREAEVMRQHRELFQAGGILSHHEEEVTLWNGKRLIFELSNSFLDIEGQAPLLFSTFRDITERKQAEKREAAFAKLGQSLSAAATLEAAARLIADTADELFGWDACTLDVYAEERDLIHPVINIDTLEGRKTDVPPARVDQPPTPTMRRVLQQGAQLVLRGDWSGAASEMIPFGDTSRRSASLMHVPIRRAQKVLGILSIQSYTPGAYDEKALSVLRTLADHCAGAMERLRAEEDLRRLNEQLEQRVRDRTAQLEAANKELEAFSYSVSHDLRAPLRHIDGFSDMLRKEAMSGLSAPGQRYLGIISQAAKRMGTLIDDLLVFSRMGRAALRPTRVKMHELVAEVLREMASDCEGRTIKWDIGPLPQVSVDRALLKQVWVNLLGNAVKYTRQRAEARIQIRCRTNDQGEFEFAVQDNGAGFDMAFAGKLFGVFQRLHQTEEFEGTGIGLANVRRIVARHGGRTWGEGRVDAGATFYFILPGTEQNSA